MEASTALSRIGLVEKGFPISVYNRTSSKVDETVHRAATEGDLPLSGQYTPKDFVLSLSSALDPSSSSSRPALPSRPENVLDIGVGLVGPPGNEARAMASTFLAAGDAHAEVEEAPGRSLVDAVLGVLIPLVAAIDDGVAGLHVGRQGGDGLVDGSVGLDEDDDGLGALEREDEVFGGVLAGEREVALGGSAMDGLVDLGGGAVVDGDGEAFLGDVEGEILAHDDKAGEADAGECGGGLHLRNWLVVKS
ncbi:hypothetical protein ACLB2K_054749 [Fragaria x ananassa]